MNEFIGVWGVKEVGIGNDGVIVEVNMRGLVASASTNGVSVDVVVNPKLSDDAEAISMAARTPIPTKATIAKATDHSPTGLRLLFINFPIQHALLVRNSKVENTTFAHF